MYVIRDSEAGNLLDEREEYLDAVMTVEAYENQDFQEGNYEPGFYEIFDTNTGKVVS